MKNLATISLCLALSSTAVAAHTPQIDHKNSLAVLADTLTDQDADTLQATLATVANSKAWHRLLLYHNHRSQITDLEFFLSDKGQSDPYAELVAVAEAIWRGDVDSMCRFPARVHFVKTALALLDADVSCPKFDAWAKSLDGQQLSLVFASEQPNILGSAFAHVFLRLDTTKSLASGKDDDAVAINYSSVQAANDSEVAFAIKSIVGGYDGGLEFLNFYDKLTSYTAQESRDVWQYRLDLTTDEVTQIIRHLWETKNTPRPYRFTSNNCATEIVRLIDVVRADKDIGASVGRVAIPSKIARVLDEQGLITDKVFVPAQSTVLQAQLNNGATLPSPLVPNQNDATIASPVHRLGISVGHDSDAGAVYGLSLRSAYQDLLDRPYGVQRYLDVEIFSLDVRYDDTPYIHQASIISTRSYNPANTARADNGKAWGKHLRLIEVVDASHKDGGDHLVLDVRLEQGKSWTLGKGAVGTGELADTLCYVFGAYGVQFGKINQGYRLGVGLNAGCTHQMGEKARFLGELAIPFWHHHDSGDDVRSIYAQPALQLGVQYDLDRKHALRLTGDLAYHHSDTQHSAQLMYLRYF